MNSDLNEALPSGQTTVTVRVKVTHTELWQWETVTDVRLPGEDTGRLLTDTGELRDYLHEDWSRWGRSATTWEHAVNIADDLERVELAQPDAPLTYPPDQQAQPPRRNTTEAEALARLGEVVSELAELNYPGGEFEGSIDELDAAFCAYRAGIGQPADVPEQDDSVPSHQHPGDVDIVRSQDAVADALYRLNEDNTVPGTCWYATPRDLTQVARDRGQVARVVFDLLTDECAREHGLMDDVEK